MPRNLSAAGGADYQNPGFPEIPWQRLQRPSGIPDALGSDWNGCAIGPIRDIFPLPRTSGYRSGKLPGALLRQNPWQETAAILECISPSPWHTLNWVVAVAKYQVPEAGLIPLNDSASPSWLEASYLWSSDWLIVADHAQFRQMAGRKEF
jgi:hypothetical protein